MTDAFTKYVEVAAVPNQKAKDCAARIANDFISRWGALLRIHSDQGAIFDSRIFQELCQLLSIRKNRTSPRNARCNGQTERYNRTLFKMIRAYLTEKQGDWDLYLGCLAGAYRSTLNESTHFIPNVLSLGREIRLPADIVYETRHQRHRCTFAM
jgi:transposase InsO family protein